MTKVRRPPRHHLEWPQPPSLLGHRCTTNAVPPYQTRNAPPPIDIPKSPVVIAPSPPYLRNPTTSTPPPHPPDLTDHPYPNPNGKPNASPAATKFRSPVSPNSLAPTNSATLACAASSKCPSQIRNKCRLDAATLPPQSTLFSWRSSSIAPFAVSGIENISNTPPPTGSTAPKSHVDVGSSLSA